LKGLEPLAIFLEWFVIDIVDYPQNALHIGFRGFLRLIPKYLVLGQLCVFAIVPPIGKIRIHIVSFVLVVFNSGRNVVYSLQ